MRMKVEDEDWFSEQHDGYLYRYSSDDGYLYRYSSDDGYLYRYSSDDLYQLVSFSCMYYHFIYKYLLYISLPISQADVWSLGQVLR